MPGRALRSANLAKLAESLVRDGGERRGNSGDSVDGRTGVKRRLAAWLALAAAAALLAAGCSTEAIFPAVHDMPPPRPEVPLTAEQVKQATDNLVTEREHLSTEVQTAAQPAPPAKTAAVKPPPRTPPRVPQAAPETAANTPEGGQTAGAYAKP